MASSSSSIDEKLDTLGKDSHPRHLLATAVLAPGSADNAVRSGSQRVHSNRETTKRGELQRTASVRGVYNDRPSVDRNGYQRVRSLGAGAFGTVDVVFHTKRPGIEYARKRFELPTLDEPMEVQLIRHASGHRHTSKFVDYYFLKNEPMNLHSIITSPVANFTLRYYLSFVHDMPYRNAVEFPERFGEFRLQLMKWVPCVVGALAYLASKGIRHRDIKPENILVHGNNIILTDFGTSFVNQHSTQQGRTGTIGTPSYEPPEALIVQGDEDSGHMDNTAKRMRAGRLGDVFSTGAVIYDMLSAASGPFVQLPFVEGTYASWVLSEDFCRQNWNLKERKVHLRRYCSEQARLEGLFEGWFQLVMTHMLTKSPETRKSAAELCKLFYQVEERVLGYKSINDCQECRRTYGER
ncbi:Rho-associated kinase [Cladobotryum mycophilum]|uniref:non-specific serine/threonine protein kinase n=1 Tax=Cladobotryum mycophilum TaxID=491253 RepID=A0ABR0SD95_9HYPO